MPNQPTLTLAADRYFDPEPQQKAIAMRLYEPVADLPLVCPHGHVDPRLFADPDYTFGNPTELLIVPDHYIFRLLYSQGYSMEELGIPSLNNPKPAVDPRRVWQIFAENFHQFNGTPTGVWLVQELYQVFGIDRKLTGETPSDWRRHQR